MKSINVVGNVFESLEATTVELGAIAPTASARAAGVDVLTTEGPWGAPEPAALILRWMYDAEKEK